MTTDVTNHGVCEGAKFHGCTADKCVHAGMHAPGPGCLSGPCAQSQVGKTVPCSIPAPVPAAGPPVFSPAPPASKAPGSQISNLKSEMTPSSIAVSMQPFAWHLLLNILQREIDDSQDLDDKNTASNLHRAISRAMGAPGA
jgi:hypothetical protein